MAERRYRTAFTSPSGEVFRRRGSYFEGSRGTRISRRQGEILRGRPLPPATGKWEDIGVSRVTGRHVYERTSKGGMVSARPLERFLASRKLSDDAYVQVAFGVETRDYPVRPDGKYARPSAVMQYRTWKVLFEQAGGKLSTLAQLVMPGQELRSRVYVINVGIAP